VTPAVYGAPGNQLQNALQNVGAGRGMGWSGPPQAQNFSNGFSGYDAFTGSANAYGGRQSNLSLRTTVAAPPSSPQGRRFLTSPLTLTNSPVTSTTNPFPGFGRVAGGASLDTIPSFTESTLPSSRPINRPGRWPSSGAQSRGGDESDPGFSILTTNSFAPTTRQPGVYGATGPASAPAEPPPLPWRRGAGPPIPCAPRVLANRREDEPEDMFPPLSGLGQTTRRTGT
jgi:hypothetical protein